MKEFLFEDQDNSQTDTNLINRKQNNIADNYDLKVSSIKRSSLGYVVCTDSLFWNIKGLLSFKKHN